VPRLFSSQPTEISSTEGAMLDHVTLRTRDLEGAKAFFETVLGLEVGYRPAFPFPGYWLYAAGQPIVHLIPGQGGPVDRSGETIDHVAFRLDGHEAMGLKLDRLSIPYSQMDLPELGERRFFIRTPTGILLELVFRDPSAESVSSTSQEQIHAE
jgi:catechol 2,3-dioxygenase-like lactoylglutathione lyase family enzyme